MRHLGKVKIGKHEIEVVAHSHDGGKAIVLKATCGETTREHSWSQHPNPDYSEEQFNKDAESVKQLIAAEAAGHEHTRLMREKFLNG